jgi:hypothetical protein
MRCATTRAPLQLGRYELMDPLVGGAGNDAPIDCILA